MGQNQSRTVAGREQEQAREGRDGVGRGTRVISGNARSRSPSPSATPTAGGDAERRTLRMRRRLSTFVGSGGGQRSVGITPSASAPISTSSTPPETSSAISASATTGGPSTTGDSGRASSSRRTQRPRPVSMAAPSSPPMATSDSAGNTADTTTTPRRAFGPSTSASGRAFFAIPEDDGPSRPLFGNSNQRSQRRRRSMLASSSSAAAVTGVDQAQALPSIIVTSPSSGSNTSRGRRSSWRRTLSLFGGRGRSDSATAAPAIAQVTAALPTPPTIDIGTTPTTAQPTNENTPVTPAPEPAIATPAQSQATPAPPPDTARIPTDPEHAWILVTGTVHAVPNMMTTEGGDATINSNADTLNPAEDLRRAASNDSMPALEPITTPLPPSEPTSPSFASVANGTPTLSDPSITASPESPSTTNTTPELASTTATSPDASTPAPTSPQPNPSPSLTRQSQIDILASLLVNVALSTARAGGFPVSSDSAADAVALAHGGGALGALGAVIPPPTPGTPPAADNNGVIESGRLEGVSEINSGGGPAITPGADIGDPMGAEQAVGVSLEDTTRSQRPRDLLRDVAAAFDRSNYRADATAPANGPSRRGRPRAGSAPSPATSPPAVGDLVLDGTGERRTLGMITPSPVPEEGTFARFLHDIRAELEFVVNRQRTHRRARAAATGNAATTTDTPAPAPSPTPPASDLETSDEQYARELLGLEPILPASAIERDAAILEQEDEQRRTALAAAAAHDAANGGPALSDAVRERVAANVASREARESRRREARARSRERHERAGNVNWWRTFRFPAVRMPAPSTAAGGVASASPLVVPPATAPTSPASPTEIAAPALETTPASPEATVPTEQNADLNARQELARALRSALTGPDSVFDALSAAAASETPASPTAPSESESPAAAAREATPSPLATLRQEVEALLDQLQAPPPPPPPAERTLVPILVVGLTSRGPTEPQATRDYSIYVLAGHYPPGHLFAAPNASGASVGTGPGLGGTTAMGAGPLDEPAMLQTLISLLGDATGRLGMRRNRVTNEQLARSGLKILPGKELASYAEEGKITSNCVDNCLICADEYKDEDELRLLNCKHAFHKDCVDKWITGGSNTCPVCRARAVASSSRSRSVSPTRELLV